MHTLSHMYMHMGARERNAHGFPSSRRGQRAHGARAPSTRYSYFYHIRSHMSFDFSSVYVQLFMSSLTSLGMGPCNELPGVLIDHLTKPWVGMMLSAPCQRQGVSRGKHTRHPGCASGCQVRNVTQVLSNCASCSNKCRRRTPQWI